MVIETKTENLVDKIDFASYQEKVNAIDKMIVEKSGAGSDFLGWVDHPIDYDKNELEAIIKEAQFVRKNYDVLVVCGIGGSYLGARAGIEAINGTLSDSILRSFTLDRLSTRPISPNTSNILKTRSSRSTSSPRAGRPPRPA